MSPISNTRKRTSVLLLALVAAGLTSTTIIHAAEQPEAVKAGTNLKEDEAKAIFNSMVEAIKKYKKQEAEAINEIDKKAARDTARAQIWRITGSWVLYLAEPRRSFLAEVEERRADKQEGAGASNPGSTSLVSKGSVPSLLGLAVENGALTQTVSGTSITFRTNPTGIIKALAKKDYLDSGPNSDTDAVVRFVRKTSLAITFDTSSGSQSGTFTGDRQQISGFSFRYDILNHRDPRDPAYFNEWEKLRKGQLTALADQFSGFSDAVRADKKRFEEWRDAAQAKIDATDIDGVESTVLAIAEDFRRTFGEDVNVRARVEAAAKAFSDYVSSRAVVTDKINKSPIITFEYTNTRQGAQAEMMMVSANAQPATPGVKPPDLSSLRLIVAGGTVGGAQLTGNASMTFFNSKPQGMKIRSLRDFQLSGQIDIPLPEVRNVGKPVLTFAGLFMSLREQPLGMPIEVNGVTVDTKGNIGLGQAKITFPLKKGSGVKIPLSFTYASRTELNREHDVRGNIGITFDLDSIFAGLK